MFGLKQTIQMCKLNYILTNLSTRANILDRFSLNFKSKTWRHDKSKVDLRTQISYIAKYLKACWKKSNYIAWTLKVHKILKVK